ncbi:sialate O-acetylesterase [Flavobacterium sp. 270]|uniref:sialate O-acetylesterase n=1 Tax=Flavobacterium sp. 270 TaxID=2512114 RepID=UPI001065B151|nr:sialate O-acetylesterase [Flavobacterium sp. 270]TDW48133.1 sialate O-acetylesterase [Flavobacterium sp. 270]
MKKIVFLILCFSQLICNAQHAINDKKTLSVSNLFTDHMVLQQKQNTSFWGITTPQKEVTVSASWGKKAKTTADKTGKWTLKLETPKAGGPYNINLSSGSETLLIKDVLVGEVWLASGQSNMEMQLSGWLPNDIILDSEKEIAKSDLPNIRFMKVGLNLASQPIDSIQGNWQVISPKTSGNVSATAYFFAKKLYEELHVPIGIIQSAVGGTPAEAWTSEASLEKFTEFKNPIVQLKENAIIRKDWFNNRKSQPVPATTKEWEDIVFDDYNASMREMDDSDWDLLELPGRIDRLKNDEFDGAIWLRKSFTINDPNADYQLDIASVDDMDAVYVNGKKVGGLAGSGYANAPRKMSIPKTLLTKGANTLAIRIIDTGGPGSVGSMVLSNNKGENIPLDGKWKSRLVAEIADHRFYTYGLHQDFSKRPNLSRYNSNSPTVLYNAMINPLVPFTIKGAIWYQGETNVGRAEQYKTLFPAMIKDWRSKWNYDFPFYFVQLAPNNYGGDQKGKSAALRNAQRLALNTPKTGMAVTLDVGSLTTIHPPNKKAVGDRLAAIALGDEYGKKITITGPLYKKNELAGDTLLVEFDNVGDGLSTPDKEISGFEIAGADKVFLPATAKIQDDKVIVSNAKITKPVYVRYAWTDASGASLFNKNGLPAATFTSEE